jgi:hypothetical protein
VSLLGIISILLGALSFRIAILEPTRFRISMFAILYIIHLAGTFVYFAYVQTQGGDSELYYYDELDFFNRGFALGTGVLIFFVQYMKLAFGGTYLDYFMMFHAIGFFGIAFLMRTFEEIHLGLETEQRPLALLLLLLPSLQFWTNAIGKDAPLFLAASMALWAAINIRKRYIVLGLALGLMILIRPHIALVAVVAVAVAMLFDVQLGRWTRAGLFAVALGAAAFAIATIQSALRLDLTDADSISTFLEARDTVAQSAAGGNMSVTGSFGVRLFSLLMRPFFFDVEDVFGYIASTENAFLLMIFATIGSRFWTLVGLFRRSPFIRFAVVFTIGVVVVLALSYYNVGLGLRQRTMFFPGILSIMVMLLALRSHPREDLRAPALA